MVGIPGKSKACPDCRRRRVKCDLTRPKCLRCSKAGISCRGYEQSTLWVHRTQACPNVSALSVVRETKSQVSISWLGLLQRMRTQLDSLYDVETFRQQALSIADGIYFPLSKAGNSEGDSTPSSWFRAVCQMKAPSEALDYSLLAFCATQIRLSGETRISYDETVELYNQAISKVISILNSPSIGNSDQSLAAIVMLSTCELFLFHASTSWNAHAQGISAILRNRAVYGTHSQSWVDLCRRLCVICVIQAMVQKRPLLLEPYVWRQHISPPTEVTFTGLLDLTIDLPSIMASAHELLQGDVDSVDLPFYINILLQKYHDLDNWRIQYQERTWAESKIPVYWSVPARASNPVDTSDEEKLFPFALIFSSMGAASAWIFGSSIMLDILDTILLCVPNCDSNIQADSEKIARLLCQSIEFCYRTENGTFGPQITCYSQATLLKYFAHRGLERELEWYRNIPNMKCPGASFEIDLMQFQASGS
ncbi:uncharacterized protein B0J16DRAFT_416754 [Fusarium flagelliforme]|uniref:uncharacterized protein n=1 Tax=Fusarium flagelliforme TaxID=2675880 RepID=UPI001E8CAB25|nr:uncharacterized protein B0J16DRAFT_416754 [Fusarium flagelliforme]KAH7179009.1 hypothetical protein B0J16DRAFT_416754 [Fusarium flagelliforme]